MSSKTVPGMQILQFDKAIDSKKDRLAKLYITNKEGKLEPASVCATWQEWNVYRLGRIEDLTPSRVQFPTSRFR